MHRVRRSLHILRAHPSAPAGSELVALDDAFGRVLAAHVVADDDYPNAARSAMDGFALAARSAPGAFDIVGGVAMGVAPSAELANGSAARIPTGGVLPSGADAVVPIEEARVEGERVFVDGVVERGANVVARGADMRRGEALLAPGRRLRAAEIGLLATLGITQVRVYRRPTRCGVFQRRRTGRTAAPATPGPDPRLEPLRSRRLAARDGRGGRATIRRCATRRTSLNRRWRARSRNATASW